MGAMAKLVERKSPGYRHLRGKACNHTPSPPLTLAAVQSEFSLMYRVEAEQIYETTAELGISFVAYSPLGRGLLTINI